MKFVTTQREEEKGGKNSGNSDLVEKNCSTGEQVTASSTEKISLLLQIQIFFLEGGEGS